MSPSDVRDRLGAILERARDNGFLGPGPARAHLEHSEAFLRLVEPPPACAVDLGTGGGVPGLVLAIRWPESSWILLEANRRRAEFLGRALEELGLLERVEVRCERAEELGRDARARGRADLVTARSFGPPAVTAECAAPFLRVGGVLIVADPPGPDPDRWPPAPLRQLGLLPTMTLTEPVNLRALRQVEPCPDRFPRRTGVPRKRPLF